MKIKTNFFVVLFLGIFLFSPFKTKAIVTDTIGILPAYPDINVKFSDAWFMYNLNLGETKFDAVRLFNNKTETSVVKLFALDGISTSDGAFTLAPSDVPQVGMGNWIKLAAQEIELGPESEKLVPFVVTIPKNADVGDHMGGISMQEVESLEGRSLPGTGLKFVTRVGVRMYETVPGEVKKDFEITRFDWKSGPNNDSRNFFKELLDINKKTFFFLGIKNKGNVKISPKVSLKVKNIFGMTAANLPQQEIGSVFPRTENEDSTVIWNGTPIFGRYKVEASVILPDSEIPEQKKEIIVWAVPYRIIFLLIVFVSLVVLVRLIKKYFRESSKEKMPIYKVNPGDSLVKLSEKFVVNWKKIATINEIEKPFEIRTGEKIFIPLNMKNKKIIEEMKNRGEIDPSLAEREGSGKNGKLKKLIVIFIVLTIGIGAILGIRWRNKRIIHQEIKVEDPPKQEEPKETSDKTKTGAFKKSSVSVVISGSSGDLESNNRLLNKMKLIGYNSDIQNIPGEYFKTSIEYKPEKAEQAKMVKNDLGLGEEIDLKENPNIVSDVVIYNFASKEEFLEINLSEAIRSTRGD